MSGQWHGGKGSRPRTMSVDRETYDNNWDRIFGKKKKTEQEIIDKVSKDIAEETLQATESKEDNK